MTMPPTSFLSEILGSGPIPIAKLSYFRERLKNRLYDLIVTEFLRRESSGALSRADLARRIGRRPEQVTRWLGSPGNWTLDTVSDLMLAMRSEPEISVSSLEGRSIKNFVGPEWLHVPFESRGGRAVETSTGTPGPVLGARPETSSKRPVAMVPAAGLNSAQRSQGMMGSFVNLSSSVSSDPQQARSPLMNYAANDNGATNNGACFVSQARTRT